MSSNSAVASIFEINPGNLNLAQKKKNMNNKRYAHCSLQVKGNIYVFGGFAHKDE
jgi:hypothetical protein